ncbi:MAG: hypothetical protein L0331_04765 [Chloroflexi bacterium]|nr:hypothetical protein [Chloroflexota bacterium]MCI0647178.1 hypothetical protein [Chloroflexota bacterium]
MNDFPSPAMPVTPESERPTNADGAVPLIVDLFHIPDRYLRSVHLERDFDDTASLQHYIVTRPMGMAFSRISEGLRPRSGRRAWRITGDFGTGKSSFALVLAHLLSDPTTPVLAGVRQAITRATERDVLNTTPPRMVPVLVTGAREPLVPAVARGVGRAVERLCGQDKTNQALENLRSRAATVATTGDPSQLLELLDCLHNHAARNGRSGVLLVLDELGKFLEYASLHPEKEDVYILQRLAEAAARSGDYPLIVIGLLHQGFHAYAERLPSASRFEWEKVAGRYEEITFDQPLVHVAALVAGALNVDTKQAPEDVVASAEIVLTATQSTGWYRPSADSPTPLALYPLHPTVLPVLVRFFARFGQHERSLFSFLLSSEPFGLQSFAERRATGRTYYRLPDFYDYIRTNFGHRLAGASYRSHWLRIVGTLDYATVTDLDILELKVLKAVAVLNLLDVEHLLATDTVLAAAITDGDIESDVSRAVSSLKHRGLLFHRGAAGGYCLWPSTSINLESALQIAQRTLGPVERVSAQLRPYLDASPLLARRHYIETGTLRHFEVRYTEQASLPEVVARPTDADGLVVVALCESPEECNAAVEQAKAVEVASHQEVIVAVPPPLQDVVPELQDARCWQWIADNTPELAQDSYAAAEVTRQAVASRRSLLKRLAAQFGFHGENSDVEWWRGGKRVELPTQGRLSATLSVICNELFNEAPLIRNELLNRHTLSSAAAAARMRLIERMFSAADKPMLGFKPGKAPPEKSMYLSVLDAGNVYRQEAGQFVLAIPPEDADPLRLRPALIRILALLEQGDGHRVSVPRILGLLQDRPYGVRAGVAPFLLAIVAAAHAHQIAVYEHGTFLQRFRASDFLRLIKQPAAFEFQLCRVAGVRAEVFTHLAHVFASERSSDRDPELLDVVRPLMVFAAKLPEYTRHNTSLQEPAKSVRDALLTALEPATLLFTTLPAACGLEPFLAEEPADAERAVQFVSTLREALDDLRAAYPQLLERIRDRITYALADGYRPDRSDIAHRASRVVLAAYEPRLQTFARSLTDISLSDDAWAEKVGSSVISRPSARWTVTEETRAMDEIDVLTAMFCRVEATAFTGAEDEPDVMAMRLVLTLGDGMEEALVVRTRVEDEPRLQTLAAKLEAALIDSGELRLAALARVLKNSLLANDQA